ncbi:MAG: ACT domain-containing protein [Henriciella sp.]|nr:ACT domain-containing protein [Henriciella sp.]
MAGRELETLLATLQGEVREGRWAYGTYTKGAWSGAEQVPNVAMIFEEQEGTTVISRADEKTKKDNRWIWLELTVFSDLHAVGFLAAIARALAEAGVPCNAVAGFHHDHIFVPEDKAETAIAALEALSERS